MDKFQLHVIVVHSIRLMAQIYDFTCCVGRSLIMILPLSPLPPPQVTFIDFIVEPLWETWAELVYPDAQIILDRLQRTRSYWNSQVPPSPPPGTDSSGESTVIVTVPTPKEEEEEGRRSVFLEEGEEEEVCIGSGNVSKESSNSSSSSSSSSGGSRKDSENSRSSPSDSLTKKDFKNSPAQDRRYIINS